MRRMLFLALVASAALLPAADALAETAADRAMAQSIGRRLKESGQLQDYRIGVKYEDGVVTLGGTIMSASQRDAAIRLARRMRGVVHVVDRLQVASDAPTGRPSVRNVLRRMENSLLPTDSDPAPRAPQGIRQATVSRPQPRMMQNPPRSVGQRSVAMAENQARSARLPVSSRPRTSNMPLPAARIAVHPAAGQGVRPVNAALPSDGYASLPSDGAYAPGMAAPMPTAYVPGGAARAASYDNAYMPAYAWPSYASYPNYAALSYPQQYSPTAWPYIGPFYPYPQVPLAWRKVSLEWDDGWWFLDFSAHNSSH